MRFLLFLAASCSILTACRIQEFPSGDDFVQITYSDIEKTARKDTLYRSCKENGEKCSFVNSKGRTVASPGKYDSIYTDTFVTYAFVRATAGSSWKAINRKGDHLYDAYPFEKPDPLSEGLFRFTREGRIGYANATGEVVVPAAYSYAEPFKNGKARIGVICQPVSDTNDPITWQCNEWFYIDKTGRQVE